MFARPPKAGVPSREEPQHKLTLGLRSYQEIKEAHLKKSLCPETKEYQETKECTFQPQRHSHSIKKQQRRSLKKFLADQQKFEEEKEQRITQLRDAICHNKSIEKRDRPSIDSMSKKMAGTSHSGQVFERLSKQKPLHHHYYQEELFSPKILNKSKSIYREKDVSSLLYEDAIRRRHRESMNLSEIMSKEQNPCINPNTNHLVIKKIHSEFTEMVQEDSITPLLAISVIYELFNVDLNPNQGLEKELLCQKVLSHIADVDTEMVSSEVLWNFIQTIVNGHLVDSNFTSQQQDSIIQNFGYFYRERVTKERKAPTPQKPSFAPKTLRSSEKMAENHRTKTLEKINDFLGNEKVKIDVSQNTVRIEDVFIIEHIKKSAENQRKKIEKENKALQQCTFKPDLSKSANFSSTPKKNTKVITLVAPKSTKTQELQKKYKIKKKEQEQIDKENQQRVKTMYNEPLQKKNQSSNIKISASSRRSAEKKCVKNMDQSVMRMTMARKNRQLVNALNQRGYPQSVSDWNKFKKDLKRDLSQSSERVLRGYNSMEKISGAKLAESKQIF